MRGLGWLLLTLGALVASALWHLDTPSGRESACATVRAQLGSLLEGDFAIERCTSLAPGHVALRGFAARRGDDVLLSVEEVSVRPSVGSVLQWLTSDEPIVADALELRGVRVDVRDPDALAALFAPVPSDAPEEEGGGPMPTIQVGRLQLDDVRARLTDELEVTLALHTAVEVGQAGEEPRVDLRSTRIEGTLEREGETVATLRTLAGDVHLGEGARSELRLEATGGPADDPSRVEGTVTAEWAALLSGGPADVGADLQLDVRPALARALGQPQITAMLETGVRGRVRANGPIDDLNATVDLETDAGPIALTARVRPEVQDVTLAVNDLPLREVVGVAPDARVDADLRVTLRATESGALRVALRGDDLRFAPTGEPALSAPQLELDATIEDDQVVVQRVALPHLSEGGHLDVTGEVGFDGAGEVRFDLDLPQVARDPNVAALVRGLQAGVRGTGRARWYAEDEGTGLDARLDLTLSGVRYQAHAAERVRVVGTVRGALPTPRADLDVRATELRSGEFHANEAHVEVRGGQPRGGFASYALGAEVVRPGPDRQQQRLRADLQVGVASSGGTPTRLRVDGDVGARGVWRAPLSVRLGQVEVDLRTTAVRIGRVALRGPSLDLNAQGTFAPRGSSDVTLTMHGLPLEVIDAQLGLDLDLRGVASASVNLRGTLRHPHADVELRVDELAVRELPHTEARVRARVRPTEDGAGTRTRTEVEVHAGGAWGRVDGRASAEAADARALQLASWDAHVEALGLVPHALVRAAGPDVTVPVDGRFDVIADLRGSLDAPDLRVRVTSDDARFEGGDPAQLALELQAHPDRADVDVRLSDDGGDIAVARLALPHAPMDALALAPDAMLELPFALDLEFANRPLDGLPRPLRVDAPLRAQLHAHVEGGAWSTGGPRADVRARAWSSQSDCSATMAGVRVQLANRHAEARVRLMQEGAERAHLETALDVPLRRWLRAPPDAPPPVSIRGAGEAIDLAHLPFACDAATGQARFALDARDLFGTSPDVRVDARIDALRIAPPRDTIAAGTNQDLQGALARVEALDVDLSAQADRSGARAEAAVRARDRLAAELRATAPLDWSDGVPALGAGEWNAEVSLDRAPVAVLVAPVPALQQPGGQVDGEIRARGSASGPEGAMEVHARGGVELLDVSLTLADPFLRLERLRGRIALDDEGLRLQDVRVSDRDGELHVDGRVALDGWTPSSADIAIHADEMPARVDGVIFAFIDARAQVDATFDEEAGHDVRVGLREVAVRIPEESGRTVQRLDQHGDVIYEDQPRYALDPGVQPCADGSAPPCARDNVVEEEEDEEATPLRARIEAQPFWVRRDDFAIQLRTELRFVSDARGARLSGPVDVRRGFIDLLGKRFEFRRGEIRFIGAASVDPRLDLTAVHTLRTGENVTVQIGGFLSRPTLQFSAPGAETERDVIALLVRGRGGNTNQSSAEARDQAASVLAGMMAGLLSSLTRKEIGQYIPVFSIESEDARSARIRAGFQADQLIPDALEDVVQGVYVEGFVGTEGDDGGQSTTGGFLIELLFPHSLVTTGTYEEPSNWSLDLTWEPL